MSEPHVGILLVDKPQGFTSHDVVAKLRGVLHTRRIGHGGTLDPMATGVLPVFVGGATKAVEAATAQDKTYRAGFTLGITTDTQDTSGRIVARSSMRVTRAQVEAQAASLVGLQQQIPPMYSAVKVDGRRLYQLARQGKEIERTARPITVHALTVLDFDEQSQTGTLSLCVSKGTYVRTLIHDLGARLGTGAAMHALMRTRSGNFALEACHSLDEIEKAAREGRAHTLFLPTDTLFSNLPAVALTDEGEARMRRGAVVFARMAQGLPAQSNAYCRVYYRGDFVAVGQVRALKVGGVGLFTHKNFR